jgi:hypothetical protein
MTAKKRSKSRPPDIVKCLNCRQQIYTPQHRLLPGPETPREHVHRSYGHPYRLGVQCAACGHYSLFRPEADPER